MLQNTKQIGKHMMMQQLQESGNPDKDIWQGAHKTSMMKKKDF